MRALTIAAAFVAFATNATAQQVPDPQADLSVAQPAYGADTGPRLVVDAAHNNFHTVEDRYGPFAQLMRNDGFRVAGAAAAFSDASLADMDILVIANASGPDGSLASASQSAFTAEEIAAVRRYVERGGALWLIADHKPFAGAAQELGRAFGIEFQNGFAFDGNADPDLFTRENGGLIDDPVVAGVRQVRSFTGSAFAALGARPIMRLGVGWSVLMPEAAGQVTADTPRVPAEGLLQGALLEVGRGRVAVFGEAAMFTAQIFGSQAQPVGMRAEGAEENKAFALAVAHWLAGPR